MRRLAVRVTLLVSALGVPGTTSALPADMPDLAVDTPSRTDASPLWDSPVAPAPPAVQPPEQPPAAPERAPSANPLWAIPLATLSNTRERPIFSASRRPPPPAVASVPVANVPPPPKAARVEPPQLSLVGTIIGGDQSFGIFVDQTTKAALRLKIGEDYLGWRLASVQGRDVSLERDQQAMILSLPQPGTGAPGQVHMQAENAVIEVPADAPPKRAGRR